MDTTCTQNTATLKCELLRPAKPRSSGRNTKILVSPFWKECFVDFGYGAFVKVVMLNWTENLLSKKIELKINVNDPDASRVYKTGMPRIWSMWAYLLFISLCGLSCWWMLTTLQFVHNIHDRNSSSVKALPRADAASRRKCLTTFFRRHL